MKEHMKYQRIHQKNKTNTHKYHTKIKNNKNKKPQMTRAAENITI